MNQSAQSITWFCVILSGLLLTGCATGPRYSDYQVPARGAGMGRIWFYRTPVLYGVAREPTVKLDDMKIGNAVSGAFFQIQTTPGEHEVSVITEATYRTSVNVSANADSYIKFRVLPSVLTFRLEPTVMSETNAMPEMQELHYAR